MKVEAIIGYYLLFVHFPIVIFLSWKLLKMQKAFIKYLKETHPDDWWRVLRRDPYAEKKVSVGLAMLTSHTTGQDLGDEKLRGLKRDLKKLEYAYFGLLNIGLAVIAYIVFSH